MGKRYIAEDGSPVEPPMHPFRTSRGGAQRRLVATSGDLIFQSLSTTIAFSVLGLLALIAAILFVAAESRSERSGSDSLVAPIGTPLCRASWPRRLSTGCSSHPPFALFSAARSA